MCPLSGAKAISGLPAIPRPHLALLGVEVLGDPALTSRLLAAVVRPFLCAAGEAVGHLHPPCVTSVQLLCLPSPPLLNPQSRGRGGGGMASGPSGNGGGPPL